MLLLLLLSSASIDEVVATSAAGNLLLPVVTFVGGVPLSILVTVLSSPVSSCLGALLKLPVVAL